MTGHKGRTRVSLRQRMSPACDPMSPRQAAGTAKLSAPPRSRSASKMRKDVSGALFEGWRRRLMPKLLVLTPEICSSPCPEGVRGSNLQCRCGTMLKDPVSLFETAFCQKAIPVRANRHHDQPRRPGWSQSGRKPRVRGGPPRHQPKRMIREVRQQLCAME